MAKKVVTTTDYIDDLDGTKASGTITFGFEGTTYEIDLSKVNMKKLSAELAPYLTAARTVRPIRGRATSRRQSSSLDLAAVRKWAAENGHAVSTRGRIAAPILEAFRVANK